MGFLEYAGEMEKEIEIEIDDAGGGEGERAYRYWVKREGRVVVVVVGCFRWRRMVGAGVGVG